MQEALKVKIATLAFEARRIREAERHEIDQARKNAGIVVLPGKSRQYRKIKKAELQAALPEQADTYAQEHYERYWNLRQHRLSKVRLAARHSLIALGFMRDRPYSQIEEGTYHEPDWLEVRRVAEKFFEPSLEDAGDNIQGVFASRFEAWLSDAKEYFKKAGNLNPAADLKGEARKAKKIEDVSREVTA